MVTIIHFVLIFLYFYFNFFFIKKIFKVSPREINKLVRSQQLDGYIETSAMTESDQVSKVFEEAARLALGKKPNFLANEPESTGCFDFLKYKL